MDFNYDNELNMIKKILGDTYQYHDFSIYMVDESAVAGYSFTVYTGKDLFEICRGTVDRLQRCVNHFSRPYSIEIMGEDGDEDDKIVVTNLDKLMERFKK